MSTASFPVDPATIARPDASPTTIRDRILRELHVTMPEIALEDVLELRVIIDPPPADQPPEDQARTVLTAIQNELETWPTGSTSSLSPDV